jgi:hypothetical protein
MVYVEAEDFAPSGFRDSIDAGAAHHRRDADTELVEEAAAHERVTELGAPEHEQVALGSHGLRCRAPFVISSHL